MAAEHLTWLTVRDLVDRLALSPGKVHRLLEDRHLLAIRRDGVLNVPEAMLRGDEPMHELRGTLTLLADNGFTDDEAMAWMLEPNDLLDASPLEALRAGRKAEVRRIAQTSAF